MYSQTDVSLPVIDERHVDGVGITVVAVQVKYSVLLRRRQLSRSYRMGNGRGQALLTA